MILLTSSTTNEVSSEPWNSSITTVNRCQNVTCNQCLRCTTPCTILVTWYLNRFVVLIC